MRASSFSFSPLGGWAASWRRAVLTWLLLCCTAGAAFAQSVAFLNPGRSNEAFWVSSTRAMEAAARQLGMPLEVIYGEREFTRVLEGARELAARPADKRPRYAIIVNENAVAPQLLRILEPAGIKVFVAWSGVVSEADVAAAGAPRQRHPAWIGQLQPTFAEAGYLTARSLIQRARTLGLKGRDGKLHLIALGGDFNSTPAMALRVAGMQQAAAEAKDVVVEQLVNARYDRKLAEEMTQVLAERFPQARLVWAGTDQMAFGAMKAMEARGLKPGKDVLFAAVNTSAEALEAVSSGRLAALSGGHFILGAWALVMIHDYERGRDFAADEGVSLEASMFALFTPREVEVFRKRFGDDRYEAVDFKRHSKVLNPKLKRYEFNFAQLLR